MSEQNENVRKVLSLLGLARAAGVLSIGQDKIIEALRRGEKLDIFVTEDAGNSAMRKFTSAGERGTARIYILKNTGRAVLGKSLGIGSAQAAALPCGSGFAEKIINILSGDRSDADE